MRASALRTALIAKIEGITPDGRASALDRMIHVEGLGLDDLPATDRHFVLFPSEPPAPSPIVQSAHPGEWTVGLTLAVSYMQTTAAAARILDDCERIVDAVLSYEAPDATITAIQGEGYQLAEDRIVALYSISATYAGTLP